MKFMTRVLSIIFFMLSIITVPVSAQMPNIQPIDAQDALSDAQGEKPVQTTHPYLAKRHTPAPAELRQDFLRAGDYYYNASLTLRLQESANKIGLDFYNDGDYDKAIAHFTPLANQGNDRAQFYLAYTLGYLYQSGRASIDDRKRGMDFFRLSAEQGNPRAQHRLGADYQFGDYGKADLDKAIAYYMESAKQNYGMAQYQLALLYTDEVGNEADYPKMVKWARRGAHNGFEDAMYSMGMFYRIGREVPQNDEMSVEWFLRAARLNMVEAQDRLARAYYEGRGVTQNNMQARIWARIAEMNDPDDDRKQFARDTNEPLSIAEFLHAEDVIENCVLSDYRDCAADNTMISLKSMIQAPKFLPVKSDRVFFQNHQAQLAQNARH